MGSIVEMFNLTLKMDNVEERFFLSGYTQLCSSHIPDRLGFLRQTLKGGRVQEKVLCAMEEKAPYKYPKRFDDGNPYRPSCLAEHYAAHELTGADSGRSPVVQVYNYMCSIGCKYGVLSTGLYTWFLRRDAKGNLYTSPTVALNDVAPTLSLAWIAFLKACARDKETVGVPSNVADFLQGKAWRDAEKMRGSAAAERNLGKVNQVRKSAQGKTNNAPGARGLPDGEADATEPGDFSIEDVTNDDEVIFKEHGVVRRALVNQSEKAVLKLVDAQKDWKGAHAMLHEIEMYQKVRSLWGTSVPRLYYGGKEMVARWGDRHSC
jgi:hypothetical protein